MLCILLMIDHVSVSKMGSAVSYVLDGGNNDDGDSHGSHDDDNDCFFVSLFYLSSSFSV